ncbi:LuxR C-terminal-related transcriptional regulator [Serratia nevei]|uniref:helix-turn-helix transcriptional regulator n=1 Tax=Serratia TaxID=613 RepID=UPI0018D93CD2|nr:LuxR family transcriptional regulator [Serratia marcescens]MBH2871184.1 hypothetical protein [Serratia marcescens]MBI6126331.1 hypothetical protein [Serratia marcescens]MBN5185109.1 hypothetical protein [Serratia marcescens]MBN5194911.1 hypothetical protein [Serratia marcescens]MBN5301068.1 hypothetical protein [Serratia marcescens]
MNRTVSIFIQDNDAFFTKGMKSLLESYFSQQGISTLFIHAGVEYSQIDLAFISTPLTKRACYCHMMPLAVHHGTRFFTVRERWHHSHNNLPRCGLEYGTLYRQAPNTAIAQLLEKTMQQPLASKRVKCSACLGGHLTRREKEVLSYLRTGASQSETAKKMHLSVKTINAHKQSMMKKMDLRKKQDFIYWVLKNVPKGASHPD